MELIIPYKKFKEHLPDKDKVPHEGIRYARAIKTIMSRKRLPYTAIVIVYKLGGRVKYSF